MIHQLKNVRFYIVVGADLSLMALSLVLATVAQFAFAIPADYWHRLPYILPWVLVVKASAFFLFGVYRGMWRYASLLDAANIAKASTLATAIIVSGLTIASQVDGHLRLTFLFDCIFTIFFCSAVRAAYRLRVLFHEQVTFNRRLPASRRRQRALLIGAGAAAERIIRELQDSIHRTYDVVACIDDNPQKHGRTLLGIPVYGPISELPRYVHRFRAAELIIAMPSVSGTRMREVVSHCERSGLRFQTVPSFSTLVGSHVSISDIRPVDLEDLLGRPAVRLDLDLIGGYLTGKRVAVTGAGGSIGSELCRQIARFHPSALILIDSCEFNLYRIEMELRSSRRIERLVPAMGRVQDRELMSRVFHRHQPQVVFHAAACKHVPMVEFNPWEGVFNNVLGSQVIMDMAEEVGAARYVQVSTDKAVRPTNVMGATKRMAEILLQSRPLRSTRFMAVRFGNVLGSSGSVIPLFQQQIRAGGPVTVTHPEMTRYFMTIPEACQLILQAGSMGRGGEIFILEMGSPVRIVDMARDLIRLSGREPGLDIPIVFTGLRPGEKLYEELITHGEGITATPHEKIMVLRRQADTTPRDELEQQTRSAVARLVRAAHSFDSTLVRATLKQYIDEYTPADTGSVLMEAKPLAHPADQPARVGARRESTLTAAVPSETAATLGAV